MCTEQWRGRDRLWPNHHCREGQGLQTEPERFHLQYQKPVERQSIRTQVIWHHSHSQQRQNSVCRKGGDATMETGCRQQRGIFLINGNRSGGHKSVGLSDSKFRLQQSGIWAHIPYSGEGIWQGTDKRRTLGARMDMQRWRAGMEGEWRYVCIGHQELYSHRKHPMRHDGGQDYRATHLAQQEPEHHLCHKRGYRGTHRTDRK